MVDESGIVRLHVACLDATDVELAFGLCQDRPHQLVAEFTVNRNSTDEFASYARDGTVLGDECIHASDGSKHLPQPRELAPARRNENDSRLDDAFDQRNRLIR